MRQQTRLYVVNIKKNRSEEIGVFLKNKGNNIVIHDMRTFPNVYTRCQIEIGDKIISVNGEKQYSAQITSQIIKETGPFLSLLVERSTRDFE